jgi:endogenous inhibitor of DNA gyrase (YacG/DUF329 family)
VNAIFQVIQNLLRRREQKAPCPGCGRPASARRAGQAGDAADDADQADAPAPQARRCPDCGRPLPDDDAS